MKACRSLLAFLLLALPGCSSTGVGNPAPVSLRLAIVQDEAIDMPSGGAAGEVDTAVVRSAVIVLGELRLVPCDPDDTTFVAPGPFIIDLLHGQTLPELPEIPLPAAGFCGLEAALAPALAPAPLTGRSLYFDGRRADGTLFQVYANMQATLRVQAREGVAWGSNATRQHTLFWALRPRRWVAPGELDKVGPITLGDGTRVIVIDIDQHPLLFQAIRSRLAGSSTLFDDANADAVFDANDRDVIIGDGLTNAD